MMRAVRAIQLVACLAVTPFLGCTSKSSVAAPVDAGAGDAADGSRVRDSGSTDADGATGVPDAGAGQGDGAAAPDASDAGGEDGGGGQDATTPDSGGGAIT